MRFRPAKNQPAALRRVRQPAVSQPQPTAAPPQMDNPYTRYYTAPRTLETLFHKQQ